MSRWRVKKTLDSKPYKTSLNGNAPGERDSPCLEGSAFPKGEFRVSSTKLSFPWAQPELSLSCPQWAATCPPWEHTLRSAQGARDTETKATVREAMKLTLPSSHTKFRAELTCGVARPCCEVLAVGCTKGIGGDYRKVPGGLC